MNYKKSTDPLHWSNHYYTMKVWARELAIEFRILEATVRKYTASKDPYSLSHNYMRSDVEGHYHGILCFLWSAMKTGWITTREYNQTHRVAKLVKERKTTDHEARLAEIYPPFFPNEEFKID